MEAAAFFTPWEVARMKRVFYSFDNGKKGYLDRDDFAQFADVMSLALDATRREQLFEEIDRNGDEHLSFNEAVKFIIADASRRELALAKLSAIEENATVATGAFVGLLYGVKFVLGNGLAAFFMDPIRLFRDYYVGYFDLIQRQSVRTSIRSLTTTTYRIVLPVSVDTAIGAAMFFTYSRVRKLLYHSPYFSDHMTTSDGAAGFVSGATSAVLQRPGAALVDHLGGVLRPKRHLTQRARTHALLFPMFVSGMGHAAFFATFSHVNVNVRDWMFCSRPRVCDETHMRSVALTCGAGCAAGAAYRIATVPLNNYHSMKLAALNAPNCKRAMAAPLGSPCALFKGLGHSLVWTMPISGLGFLAYETVMFYM